MAQIVAAMAMTHSPGLTGWFERAPEDHPEHARFIVNESVRRRLALAYLRTMEFDDGISVPMHFLNPEGTIPLVPVTMNCTVPPVPTPERSYQVGAILRDVVKAFPGNER